LPSQMHALSNDLRVWPCTFKYAVINGPHSFGRAAPAER
jgi:hypothetical protein